MTGKSINFSWRNALFDSMREITNKDPAASATLLALWLKMADKLESAHKPLRYDADKKSFVSPTEMDPT